MAITTSAKKAHRASINKRVFNLRRKKALTDTAKSFKKALGAGGVAEAEKLLPAAYQAIDKATKRGVIKANTAARKKSRLVAAIRRAEAKA
ncbi:MAG: 30S ribosomal protein S20 [Parcubacteria group bacterium 21-54-25]|nr:MAG: 30S ribosomal protein S20 [Parcubacteria group bacterium 21-54-25]HQU07715.1 30S ribosomal protein S20 [Candidatus Paceibacterota bacterium]